MKNFILMLVILCVNIELSATHAKQHNSFPNPYLLTQNNKNQKEGADYLIITNNIFTLNLEPLVTLREYLGLTVKIVEDTTIYNTFPDDDSCTAIKNYIKNAYENWDPRPSFILFVGDANEDGGSNDYIPSKIFPKYNYYYSGGCQTHCSDNWYVELEGNDNTPEIPTGRLPVESTDELDLLIGKIVDYENTSDTLDTVMIVMSGEYYNSSASVYNAIPAEGHPVKLYGNQMSAAECNTAIKNTYSTGCDLIFGICHGSLNRTWSGDFTGSGSIPFSDNDFNDLPSEGICPIVFEWG
jgi:hypothetical protein